MRIQAARLLGVCGLARRGRCVSAHNGCPGQSSHSVAWSPPTAPREGRGRLRSLRKDWIPGGLTLRGELVCCPPASCRGLSATEPSRTGAAGATQPAEKQILPSEGRLKLKTRGLRGPPPVFPSPPSLHLIFRRPIARQLVIQHGFPEPPPGTSTMAQAMCRQQRKNHTLTPCQVLPGAWTQPWGEIRVALEGQPGRPKSWLSSSGEVDEDPDQEMDTQPQRTKDRPPPRFPAPFSQGPGTLAWLSSEERPDGSSDAPAQTPSGLLGCTVAWGPQRVS
ncbi:uncharacterized protein LOC113885687 [Bos indicus x Bos taurus]|uniref:uncharacterized protein LOC113885687 n=1 Tax=Bos indicus x Bos taurus TaxID=30522 RepID=UPI000F7D229B|nr:uncharacterized protein LOC113885687 [Bos indicus x Bos taurus]